MSLKVRITDDMKTAMRAKDTARLGAIRLLQAAIKQKEVDERVELADTDVISIIDKMIKQRRDSIAQFEKGGRQDLADQEKFEVGILQAYMPQALSEAEIDVEIAAAIEATGAKAMADMGKVMKAVMEKAKGQCDGKTINQLVMKYLK